MLHFAFNSYISERHETLYTPLRKISALLQAKTSYSEIARALNCDKSTISREISRKGNRGYRPKQVHSMATKRQSINSPTITDFGWSYVEHLLQLKDSPKQITGRLKLLGWSDVPSHEAIYQYIYADKKAGGELYKHLRCQKTYRKRSLQGQDRRGRIVNRKDIVIAKQNHYNKQMAYSQDYRQMVLDKVSNG